MRSQRSIWAAFDGLEQGVRIESPGAYQLGFQVENSRDNSSRLNKKGRRERNQQNVLGAAAGKSSHCSGLCFPAKKTSLNFDVHFRFNADKGGAMSKQLKAPQARTQDLVHHRRC